MIILDRALERQEADGRPIRLGIVGSGYMARGIAAQVLAGMPGLRIGGFAARNLEAAAAILSECGIEAAPVVRDAEEVASALREGRPFLTPDPALLSAAKAVDVVIETTGEVDFGASVVVDAIRNRKHVVLVNAELDATVGPILKTYAEDAGVVLTNTDGDEPGVAMNLLRYVRSIGLRPVLAGNIKGFIDPHRTPKTQAAFAESVGQRPKMITSFADGTKLAMETTILANAAGFGVVRRGMNGWRCSHVREVLDLVSPEHFAGEGFVDYVLGAEPGSGAFVVGLSEEPIRRQYLKYFKMGDGPLYVFYTPWHLPQAEAPLTAARAVLFGDASVTPLSGPKCDVVTMAKRDLTTGETLDGIGGFTCFGTIENIPESRRANLLPMGLSEGCTLVRDVERDRALTYDDVELPVGRLADRLRRDQDRHFGNAA
jgi:predicted homoserine dehydrogenase-like protein